MAFDITEERQRVIGYLRKVESDIALQIKAKGMNASGRTINALNVQPTQYGGILYAPDYINFLETGRPPDSSDTQNGKPLIDVIKQWIIDKGLDLNPYAVTKNIMKKGTKLYRMGGNSGVLSVPLNPIGINELFESIIGEINKKATSEIYNPINDITNAA